ncbi:MAG: metallophosphoesterase [Clostridiales bacterium]|nr:metallophosphoesterase [Clostridiales bacterium]
MELQIEKSVLEIGLEKPLKVLHVTDTHFNLTDGRDSPEIRDALLLSQERNGDTGGELFPKYFDAMVDYANENCDLLVHTGDFLSHLSRLSMERSMECLKKAKNYVYIAGNHDYVHLIFDGWEDDAYRMNSYPETSSVMGKELLFNAREFGGVDFVGIDDSYNQVEDWQTWRLRREAEKGLPIVLLMHVPIFEESLFEKTIAAFPGEPDLVGCDEEHLLRGANEYRAVRYRPSEATMRFVDYVRSEPLIKAVLTGHLHFNHESVLPSGAVQYVTRTGIDKAAREITFC